jgi:hypothetical protein
MNGCHVAPLHSLNLMSSVKHRLVQLCHMCLPSHLPYHHYLPCVIHTLYKRATSSVRVCHVSPPDWSTCTCHINNLYTQSPYHVSVCTPSRCMLRCQLFLPHHLYGRTTCTISCHVALYSHHFFCLFVQMKRLPYLEHTTSF